MEVPAVQAQSSDVRCPRCGEGMLPKTVRTAVWQGSRVAIVEDIPAYVCDGCSEQCYDGPVSDALRRLAEEGFPSAAARAEIAVPVFSLNGRIKPVRPMPEDVHVD